jgi:starch synthase
MPPLKLCILSSEFVPYAKTGGLADVAGALVRHLPTLGHEVRAFMPLYPAVRRDHSELQPVAGLQQIPLTIGMQYEYSLQRATFPGTDALMYFVDCPALFDRGSLYTHDPDEHRRFLLFTRAALDSCRRLKFAPDIFHCNDWHTAFVPLFLKTLYQADASLSRAKSLMTIHNIGYQGVIAGSAAADIGLGRTSELDQADLSHGIINALKTGIKYADRVSTVSPTYAREICDSPLGMGLQTALRSRTDAVVGILNGVDYREWDPRHDPYLTTHFGPENIRGKSTNKEALSAMLKLNTQKSSPVIGMVTRLAEQKGIDLLFDTLPALLQAHDFGLVVLGSGEAKYETFFADLARRFAGRVAYTSGFNEPLAHMIEAGSDIFLMPSRYEPCGLNQMYSLRYGTIPVVRKTGGLADSVEHFDVNTGSGTGCVFNDYDAPAVRWAIETAVAWYANPVGWRQLMRNGMRQDFSWSRRIGEYDSLYRSLLSPLTAAPKA